MILLETNKQVSVWKNLSSSCRIANTSKYLEVYNDFIFSFRYERAAYDTTRAVKTDCNLCSIYDIHLKIVYAIT